MFSAYILEDQRYGRNKDTIVNKSYISGGEYRYKFDNATDNANVNRTLYQSAKASLEHRSGTKFEDMYWIDAETGEIICSITDSSEEQKIAYSKSVQKKIETVQENGNEIITIHSHPASMPPSLSDFNCCFKNKYKCGFICCHDGKIFRYSASEEIGRRDYEMVLHKFLLEGFSEYTAQIKTINCLKEEYDYGIDFSEVTSNDKK